MHFRKDDTVQIIAGDDKGATGRVLQVFPAKRKVLVQGINQVYRHMKPSRQNQQGGRLSKEMPVSASNVLLYCTTCRRGVRIGKRYTGKGEKERFCRKCSNGLGRLSKARDAYVDSGDE